MSLDRTASDIENPVLPCDIEFDTHRLVERTFLMSGRKLRYALNERGYRSESFDPDAAFRLCVFGETPGFGQGVNVEHGFAHLVKQHIAKAFGLEPDRVNCLNFSAPGASADYILRTLCRQLPHVPTDLILCQLPGPGRIEYFDENGPTTLDRKNLGHKTKGSIALTAWAGFQPARSLRINYIKTVLALQDQCRAFGVDHVLASEHIPGTPEQFSFLTDYLAALDPAGLLRTQEAWRRPPKGACSADALHAQHRVFALALLDRYAKRLHSRKDPRAAQLAAHVQAQKLEDPAWVAFEKTLSPDVLLPEMKQPSGPLTADVRAQVHAPHAVLSAYGSDKSRNISYRLNAQGYRSEAFAPDAAFRICLLGESHGFGVGVAQDCTVTARLKHHIAGAFDLKTSSVNALSFALGGQSMEYCLRTAYRQLSRIRADLVVCLVPYPERVEHFWKQKGHRSLNAASLDPEALDEAPEALLAFADFYTPQMGHLNLIKNMLLLQGLCNRRGMTLVMATQHVTKDQRAIPPLDSFAAVLRDEAVLDDELLLLRPDRAEDGSHAGPRTHGALAIALLERYAMTLRKSGASDRATALERYLDRIRETDPDWAFCRNALRDSRHRKPPATSPLISPQTASAKEADAAQVPTPAAFDWRACWYPIAFLEDLPRDTPTGLAIYDEPLMVYFDGDGAPHCLEDRCPHRGARLSDGQIRDGRIECLYHGWQFDGEGTCQHIPQWIEGMELPIRSCVRSYPVAERNGILWVWPGDPNSADPAQIPGHPGSPDLNVVTFQMDLPYDQSYLIENVIDVAHIHIAHDGVRGGGLRAAAKPLKFEVSEITAKGFHSRFRSLGLERDGRQSALKGALVEFVAPNLVRYTSEYQQTDLKAGLELYSIPLGKNRCRLLYRKYANFSSWRDRLRPRWIEHQSQMLLLEGDMNVVTGQAAWTERFAGSLKSMWLPLATSDRLVVEYRKWLDRFGASLPFYRGFETQQGDAMAQPDRNALPRDRWTQHTQICATCQRAVRRIDLGCRALCVWIALCAGLALLADDGAGALPAVLAGMVGLIALWALGRLRRRF